MGNYLARNMTNISQHKKYNQDFYNLHKSASYNSAKIILPLIIKLIKPQSTVDVGCGIGTWLKVCSELGIKNLKGIDGAYVKPDQLLISKNNFLTRNLATPISLKTKFDLAISVEVAEHIPPEQADIFLKNLTSLSDVILFSAAIPFQGGDDHFNEQWPEYWAQKFKALQYQVYDIIRPQVWWHPQVACYYAQNIFLYVKKTHLKKYPKLKVSPADLHQLSRVHPQMWHKDHDLKNQSLKRLLQALPYAIFNFFARRQKYFINFLKERYI
jgi:SAM-dependent methyltransferase